MHHYHMKKLLDDEHLQMENYLQIVPQFMDGRGLNPLLQNYWMVIHPPVLFLGFSLTMIPFCYAIAALWKKEYSKWNCIRAINF